MTCSSLIIHISSFILLAPSLILLSTIFTFLEPRVRPFTGSVQWNLPWPKNLHGRNTLRMKLCTCLCCCYIPGILLDVAGVLIPSVNRLVSIMEIIVMCDHFVCKLISWLNLFGNLCVLNSNYSCDHHSVLVFWTLDVSIFGESWWQCSLRAHLPELLERLRLQLKTCQKVEP